MHVSEDAMSLLSDAVQADNGNDVLGRLLGWRFTGGRVDLEGLARSHVNVNPLRSAVVKSQGIMENGGQTCESRKGCGCVKLRRYAAYVRYVQPCLTDTQQHHVARLIYFQDHRFPNAHT